MYGPTTDFGEQLHAMKYRQPGETFRDAMNRIANALTEDRESYMDFREILLAMRFMPAGRIQAAVGAVRRTTPYNCFSGEQEFLTRNGVVKFKDVVDQEVEILSPVTGQWHKTKVEMFGEQDVFNYKIAYGFRSNGATFSVKSTENHSWILKNGERTNNLSVRNLLAVTNAKVKIDPRGLIHGFVFGDGTRDPSTQRTFVLTLFGGKAKYADLVRKSEWFRTERDAEGNPSFRIRVEDDRDLKSIPVNESPEYIAGFLQGWIAMDGTLTDGDNNNPSVLTSINIEALEWARNYLPLAGFTVCGGIHLSMLSTPWGDRIRPQGFLYIRRSEHHRGMRVVEKKFLGKEPVYCVSVPDGGSAFTLTNGLATGNCYVSGIIPDSFVDRDNEHNSSIMHRAEQAAATMRLGGGIGYDFSTLRPNGALIKSLQSTSSGVVPFMKIFDHTGKATSSAGHRRGAQMGVLRIDHPDIPIFVNAKHDQDTLSGFNISVAVTDQFMEHLETGKAFPLVFGGQVYNEIDPTALWETIMRSTWDWGEPGVLFIDQINRMNNLWYCEKLAATNPCVPKGTPILTKTGWLPIEECLEDSVEVWNGEEWSHVTPRVTGINQSMVTVSLSNAQSLICTVAHGFYLSDGTRVEASELKEGDELLEMDWPVIEGGVDHPEAYTQGVFAGDGWYASNNRPYISFKREDKKKSILPNIIAKNIYDVSKGYTIAYLKGTVVEPKDFVPDCSWSVKSRLDWLAGLLDTDGSSVWSYNDSGERTSCSLSVTSANKEFIQKLALMLRTLGVTTNGDVDTRPGRWDKESYNTDKSVWRLGIRAWDVVKLRVMGLLCHRHDLDQCNPNRSCRPKLRVTSVVPAGVADVVYCFTEPKAHRGCFAGVLTAQCGEQPLPPFGACLLGSFNLIQYVRQTANGGYEFDWENFIDDIPVVVEAMDNVIDIAIYPLPEQEAEAKNKRRMGLGYTALANAAETLGFPYGSQEFLKFQEAIGRTLMNESYRASALLASRKGSFPLYDSERYLQGKYVQGLDPDVLYLIRRYGIRNSHLTSIAPTGTISMSADNVSSGAEPVFSLETQRPVNTPDGQIIATLQDYAFGQFGTIPKLADSVSIQEHLDVLVTAQKYVDSAVSKTCNVSPDMPWDEFKGVYKKAFELGCKGLTTFNPEGKRMTLLKKSSAPKPVVITPVQQDKNEDMYNLALATAGEACTFDPATGRKSCE